MQGLLKFSVVFTVWIVVCLELTHRTQARELVATAVLRAPYVLPVKGSMTKFKGFAVDLADAIAKELGFNYTIKLCPDQHYGALRKNGRFDGMIGELMKGRADFSLGGLTKTYIRGKVVDFTHAFQHIELSMIARRQDLFKADEFVNYTFFLWPFDLSVWILIAATFLTITLCLTLMNYLNPYEWGRRSKRRIDFTTEGTQDNDNFGFKESLFFTLSSLCLQGYTKRPISIAGRILAAFWWMFSLIVIVCYIAVLVRDVPVDVPTRAIPRVSNLEGLAQQTDLKFGTLINGSTYNFFKTSQLAEARVMWTKMNTWLPSVFTDTMDEGIDRVRREPGYIFIAESSIADYVTRRECDLVAIPTGISKRGYGIALQKNSEFREPFSNAIMQLEEQEIIYYLLEKWWGPNRCRIRPNDHKDVILPVEPLSLNEFYGVVAVLVFGVVLAIVVSFIECCVYACKRRKK